LGLKRGKGGVMPQFLDFFFFFSYGAYFARYFFFSVPFLIPTIVLFFLVGGWGWDCGGVGRGFTLENLSL